MIKQFAQCGYVTSLRYKGGDVKLHGFPALVAVMGKCRGCRFSAHVWLMVGAGFHAHVDGRKFIKRC